MRSRFEINVKVEAAVTAHKIRRKSRWLFLFNRPSMSRTHLLKMASKIISGEVTGEKAHRWLGWLQAGAYAGGCENLKEPGSVAPEKG